MAYYNYKADITADLIGAVLRAVQAGGDVWGIGDNVFPMIAPQGTTGTIVVIRQQDETVDRSKMGITRTAGVFKIHVLGDDWTGVKDAAVAIAKALEGATIGQKCVAEMDGMAQDWSDGKYVATATINVIDKQPGSWL